MICNLFFSTCNSSCGKVMFSQVCVKNSVPAMRCGDPTWNDPNFGSPKIAPKAECTTYMSKLDIFRNPKVWAIHVGSPHLMAVTGCNELILANNSKTEFRSFSYNYNSKACWQKKVLPEQVIFKTF